MKYSKRIICADDTNLIFNSNYFNILPTIYKFSFFNLPF